MFDACVSTVSFTPMPNDEAQMPNQIQNSNVKLFWNLDFDIHLIFACLPALGRDRLPAGRQGAGRQGF
jgi:hypothetical protein